jgi:GH15 family glucan-1,4-alpha-glucosidase
MLGTLKAIEQRLLVDGFVRRYEVDADDGLPPGEGVFLACSFWLVDAYILQKRFADARALLDRLLALRNDLGLLSEEYDPVAQRLLGNFPQAFTHVALVNSAFNLTRAEKPVEQRAHAGKAGLERHALDQLRKAGVIAGRVAQEECADRLAQPRRAPRCFG